MPPKKRAGGGGNSSKDPRSNLVAQKTFKSTSGAAAKKCTGFLHHDADPVPITSFRQQKANASTGLQSRCDTCNRLYFSVIQKPIKKLAAIVIWSDVTKALDWKRSCPKTLIAGLQSCVDYWISNPCQVAGCRYKTTHGSYRNAASHLTSAWRNLDKGPKSSQIVDSKSGTALPAPQFMHDLQEWAGLNGALWDLVNTNKVWDWWCKLYLNDSATCSLERNAASRGEIDSPAPDHPLSDFTWGSGNILETSQGHSVPGFNQVRASVRVLPRASNLGNRVYGFLVEGDHLAMAKFSAQCKAQKLSLGHFPAPLRWLGKNDPANAKAQPLNENVALSDSLVPLHSAAIKHPHKARHFVSWQIADTVVELGKKKVSIEEFTQSIQATVEEYLDELEASLDSGIRQLLKDLATADPGQPQSVYIYRAQKVSRWLKARPASRKKDND